MASPIMHVVLALKILFLLPSALDKKEFIIGTSFPDIRYLAHLSREETHIEPVSWSDITTCSSSFKAGMLFHNLVDILRIIHFEPHFYQRQKPWMYSTSHIRLFPLVMKMAEDHALYDTVHEWNEIIGYFDTILEEEKALCPDLDILQKWHRLLQNYFRERPSAESVDQFLRGVGGINLYTDRANFNSIHVFENLVSDIQFIEKIQEFYELFETLLSSELLETPPITCVV